MALPLAGGVVSGKINRHPGLQGKTLGNGGQLRGGKRLRIRLGRRPEHGVQLHPIQPHS